MNRFLLALAAVAVATAVEPPEVRSILQELIEINTTNSSGSTTLAAEAVAKRLRAGGFAADDVWIGGPTPRKGNLVARLRGSGAKKPILFLAHLDVVEARREDWSFDPFILHEQDGYFYGRGVLDNKAGAAVLVATFLRWKREGLRPDRDFLLALTADEEGGDHNGVEWLLDHHRGRIDAEYCINTDSGLDYLRDGKRFLVGVQTAEKRYHSVRLEVRNKGGHSSLPEPDNAIYRLAGALSRLAQYQFPVRLTPTTRLFFERTAALESGQTAADMRALLRNGDPAAVARLSASPYYNALLRTTCVATMLDGGHAENALPQTARATVNCRILPGEEPAEVERALVRAAGDAAVAITPLRATSPNPESPLRDDILGAVRRTVDALWPGVAVMTVMETGGTDGRLLRGRGIPTYGTAGLFLDPNDVRAHGKDERILVESLYQAAEYFYRLGRALVPE